MRTVQHMGSRWLRALSMGVVLLVVLAVGASAQQTSVVDELLRLITAMQSNTLELMDEFIQTIDDPNTPADERAAMLQAPQAWLVERGVEISDAVIWAGDLTLENEEGKSDWITIYEYLGDNELNRIGIGLCGPEICQLIRDELVLGEDGQAPDSITQAFLSVITNRSAEDWNELMDIVLEVNRSDDAALRGEFFDEMRAFAVARGQRLSVADTQLYGIALPPAVVEYGSVAFGEIPPGMVRATEALVLFGETGFIVYQGLF